MGNTAASGLQRGTPSAGRSGERFGHGRGGSFLVAIAALDGRVIKTFPFNPGDKVVFGREGCDVVLDDVRCSRRHFEIHNLDGRCTLKDLGSSNGTLVNEKRALIKVLEDGDEVRVGNTVARLRGKLAGEAPQVMMEVRGLVKALPKSGEDSLKDGPTATTMISRAALAAAVGRPLARRGRGGMDSLTFLPAVWQVCRASFDNPYSPVRWDRMVEGIVILGGAERAAVVKLKGGSNEVDILAEFLKSKGSAPLPVLPELVGKCSSTGAAVSVPNVTTDRRYLKSEGRGELRRVGTVYASLASIEEVYGVVYAEWPSGPSFGDAFSWTCAVASQMGLLIDRNALAAELRRLKR